MASEEITISGGTAGNKAVYIDTSPGSGVDGFIMPDASIPLVGTVLYVYNHTGLSFDLKYDVATVPTDGMRMHNGADVSMDDGYVALLVYLEDTSGIKRWQLINIFKSI